MIQLYHNDLSSCAQKVRIALDEKQISWTSHHLNLRKGDQFDPGYLKLNPNGVVPTLVHGDVVVIESNIILEYIEDAFPTPSLRPTNPAALAAMRLWFQQLDTKVHGWVGILTMAISTRHEYLAEGPEGVAKAVDQSPDENKRKFKRALIELGVEAPFFPGAVADVDKFLGQMDAALAKTGWLAGDAYSIADIALTPYIARFNFLGLAPFWAERPYLRAWFDRVSARPSFQKVIIDDVAPKRVSDMIANGAQISPRLVELRSALKAA
ncbi:glutathione S-transferase family protein [Vitreimonas sp.]|uniref:glutathione S-transferase family protein n=1 Tax=Vitreimonas sp. TaxID=3069702 RepID=UPI002EDB646F